MAIRFMESVECYEVVAVEMALARGQAGDGTLVPFSSTCDAAKNRS